MAELDRLQGKKSGDIVMGVTQSGMPDCVCEDNLNRLQKESLYARRTLPHSMLWQNISFERSLNAKQIFPPE